MSDVRGRLAGHVSVITGAGQGIGRGIALAMAKEGASVALAGRTLRKVHDVAEEITGLGGRALAAECDVRCREQVDAAVAATVPFGGIDSLVNNAQSSSQQTLEETTDQHADECWRSGRWGRSTKYRRRCRTCGRAAAAPSSTSALARPSGETRRSALMPWPRRPSAGCPG